MRKFLIAACVLFSGLGHATEEARLNVYNWAEYIGADTIQRFTEETGIEVSYDTFDSLEMLETKLLTGGSGYDVVVPSANVLQRAIQAGAVQPLERSRLTGFKHLDSDLLAQLATQDPGNSHGAPYTWGTIGLGMNVEAVRKHLPDAPLDSLDLLFDPALSGKLAGCGIAVIDSPQEVTSVALHYLGLPPQSNDKAHLKAAADLLAKLRPNVRYIHSIKLLNDLADGEICMALAYSGDVGMAALRAGEANQPFEVRYNIPHEGTMVWIDTMAIPVDAPHPQNAHRFIDFMLRPEVIAEVSNTIWFANANSDATSLLIEDVRNDPGIYPASDVRAKLFGHPDLAPKEMRKRSRLWNRFRNQQ